MKALGQKFGRYNGLKLKESGIGIFGLTSEQHAANSRIAGQKNIKSGHMKRLAELNAKNGLYRKIVESGQLHRARCQRWKINRGKSCVCGQHEQMQVAA
jgi:hypothetical protein